MGFFSRFRRGPRTVRVSTVDAESGAEFARSDLPAESLPESFELSTTMHVQGQDWQVVEALPPSRADFARTGRLRLSLRRLQSVDPSEIRFSLPTLSNEQAPLEPLDPESPGPIELAGDDWRQVEFVEAAHAAAVDEELAAIRRVIEANEGQFGFEAVHVRRAIPAPLDGGLSRTQVLEQLAEGGPRDVVTESALGEVGRVKDGFAFEGPSNVVVYGVGDDRVTVLAVTRATDDPAVLLDFAARNGLLLVDWCACRRSGN